jgi:aspartate/methionine/tyrosine aminotransferase
MTGCRLGYVATPSASATERLTRVQEATLVSPSTPVQYAALGALTDTAFLAEHHGYVRATMEAVLDALPGGLIWAAPAGGWYLMVDLSAYTADSNALCRDLLERTGLALAPGLDFFPPGDVTGAALARLTLCQEREQTLEGIRRLHSYLGGSPQ